MPNKISTMLDNLADLLEEKGLIKEAYEIDAVSNSLDNKIAYDISRAINTNPIIKGKPIKKDKETIQDLKQMSQEDINQAIQGLINPQSLQQKNASIQESIRTIASAIKSITSKITSLSPLFIELGLNVSQIINSLIPDGFKNPSNIIQFIASFNTLIRTFIEYLKNDGKIDALEANKLAPMISDLLKKLGLNIPTNKIVLVLQKIDFTSKMISVLDNYQNPEYALKESSVNVLRTPQQLSKTLNKDIINKNIQTAVKKIPMYVKSNIPSLDTIILKLKSLPAKEVLNTLLNLSLGKNGTIDEFLNQTNYIHTALDLINTPTNPKIAQNINPTTPVLAPKLGVELFIAFIAAYMGIDPSKKPLTYQDIKTVIYKLKQSMPETPIT